MTLTQAQVVCLKGLETRAGRISAPRVLAEARKASSPLHVLFDWNVKQAAEHWWLHQARLIIGAVTIQVTHHDAVLKAPVYIVDTSVKGGGYRSTLALQKDSESARESLIYTLEIAAGHLRRAYDLAVPLGLTEDIDTLLAQVAGVKRLAAAKKVA